MLNFQCALPLESYTWRNALLWGNFKEHCDASKKGKILDRVIHALIAAVEFLPIVGQIASIFEKVILTGFETPQQHEQIEQQRQIKQHVSPLDDDVQKIAAAKKIQRTWRGYIKKVRTKTHELPPTLVQEAIPYIHPSAEAQKKLTRAPDGKTPVHFIKDIPVIIKCTRGDAQALSRIRGMWKARSICRIYHYEHLVIPRVAIRERNLLESRLLITSTHTKRQIGLYVENRDLFTKAVKEFAEFLCRSDFDDLLSGKGSYIENFGTPRFDNLPLYIEDGVGKIGLIDLEGFSPLQNPVSKEVYEQAILTTLAFFPLHFDEIFETVARLHPPIRDIRDHLKNNWQEFVTDKKHWINAVYRTHADFLQRNKVTIANPSKIVPCTESGIERIKQDVEKFLQDRNGDQIFSYFLGMLGTNPVETINDFTEKALPHIISLISEFLAHEIQRNINRFGGPISSLTDLAYVRTIEIDTGSSEKKTCVDKIHSHLTMFLLNREKRLELGRSLFNEILSCLATEHGAEGGIVYYNPSFGVPQACIFC